MERQDTAALAPRGVDVASRQRVDERRRMTDRDRRRHTRSGRRAADPDGRGHWRRVAWLFAAYAAYLSIRSLPSALKRIFNRPRSAV